MNVRAKIVITTLWAFAAAGFILTACNRKPDNAPEAPLPVTIIAAQAGTPGRAGAYSANVTAETQVAVAFNVNGYVTSILQIRDASGKSHIVQSGDPIKAGEVLAGIRDDTYRQQVLRATSDLASARASLAKSKADYSRYSMLLKERVAPQADYDAAKQQYDSASAQVDSANATLKQAQVDLNDCRLKSPLTGLVLARNIEVGTLVGPSTVAFQVGDTKKVKVVFGVAASIVHQVKVGEPISITTDAFPGKKFEGMISKVAAAADPTSRVFDVEALILNPGDQLKVGMIAGLQLPGAIAAPGVVVPIRAIVRPPNDPSGYAVYVADQRDGKTYARLTPIEVGPVTGEQVGVESGLAPGADVIVKGADIVYDGQQVSVVP